MIRLHARNYKLVILIIAFHVILAITVRTVFAAAYKIPSASMYPTLQVGDQILVNKTAYGLREPFVRTCLAWCVSPQKGDVIVFVLPQEPSKDFIKRVIGTPGDLVEIKNKQVILNGEVVTELYARFEDDYPFSESPDVLTRYGPTRVPEDKLFVLGDNRNNSYDSRFWGFVDLNDVRGRASLIYWSWNSQDKKVRWARIGKTIQ